MGSDLFEYVAAVTLSDEGKPVLKHVFPEDKQETSKGILHFCWPEGKAALENLEVTTRSENFSFVLTESDGSKRFGYCRRFLRSSPPECLCVVSALPSVALFHDLLNIVEMRGINWDESCAPFLAECLKQQCPDPGAELKVQVPSIRGDGSQDELTLARPEVNEILLDYVTFFTLFSCVSVKNIVHLFSNALLERRIILVAENLSTLSSCVMAASNLLQPFHWQHVYIPVLPLVLMDYCTAPMPFFVGVLKSCLPMLETMPLEEVLVLDVENDKFLMDPGFDEALPHDDRKKLIKTLKAINPTPERDSDLQIASAFYQFFYDIFCGYEDFYELQDLPPKKGADPNDPVEQGFRFQMDKYLATKNESVRGFLEEFGTAQVLQTFLQESEVEGRRYQFVSQQEYLQHLAVSRNEEMAEAVRSMGRMLGNAWKGVREAAAKKRSEKKLDDLKKSDDLSASGPVRVPDSENIDIILAKEMSAKRMGASGATASPGFGRKATHKPCSNCKMYIDSSMQLCPHCQSPQESVTVALEPIKRPTELDERYKKPPPPPPKKGAKKTVPKKNGQNAAKKPPPPPPPVPKKPLKNRETIVPDISTLHLTLSEVFEEDPDDYDEENDEMYNEIMAASSVSPPGKTSPVMERAEIVQAPPTRVAQPRSASASGRSGSVGGGAAPKQWQSYSRNNEIPDPPSHHPPKVPPHPTSYTVGTSPAEDKKSGRRAPPPPPPHRRSHSVSPPHKRSASFVEAKISKSKSNRSSNVSQWCHSCGEVNCDCVIENKDLGGGSGSCDHCGTRVERSDARFCVGCGKPIISRSPSIKNRKGGNSGWIKNTSTSFDRASRRRICDKCKTENDIIASQCANCKEWF